MELIDLPGGAEREVIETVAAVDAESSLWLLKPACFHLGELRKNRRHGKRVAICNAVGKTSVYIKSLSWRGKRLSVQRKSSHEGLEGGMEKYVQEKRMKCEGTVKQGKKVKHTR